LRHDQTHNGFFVQSKVLIITKAAIDKQNVAQNNENPQFANRQLVDKNNSTRQNPSRAALQKARKCPKFSVEPCKRKGQQLAVTSDTNAPLINATNSASSIKNAKMNNANLSKMPCPGGVEISAEM